MKTSSELSTLQTFRQALYRCFERRGDARLELTDALLAAGSVLSPVHLSLEGVHRRGWGSLYAALAKGRVNSAALRSLLARHPLSDGQPIYAVDCSVWARGAAQTSPERGYY
jgi:DDE superfamily endonuclease